jgi:alkylation response protein AidB-like acyl-CoA dehydrogenase
MTTEKIGAALQQIQVALTASSGKIDDAVLTTIHNNGLFKCILPQTVGGHDLSMQQLMQVLADCAALNGSLGWLMQLGNGGNFFYPLFAAEVGHKLFAEPNAVIAGSGAITGTATRVYGGYNVTGEWKYCSGTDYASMFTANCQCGDEVLACTLMPEQVTIINDWDAIGLKHTSTHTIRVHQAFVSHEHTFKLDEIKNKVSNPVFDIPFIVFAKLLTIKVQHGLLRAMIQEAESHSKQRFEKWPHMPERLLIMQSYLNQCESCVEEFAKCLSNGSATPEQTIYAEVAEQNTRLMGYAYELWHMCGIDVVYGHHRLTQCFTDMLVAGQHSLLRNTFV